jgi:ACT domain-containing protein
MFAMVLLADISKLSVDFTALSKELDELGVSLGLKIHTMREDIFSAMHRI